MMNRPTLEVVLSLVDKITAPLRGTSQGVRGMFSDMTKEVAGFVGGFLALGQIKQFLQSSWEAADRFNESIARVSGTAKIMKVPMEEVVKTSEEARKQFGLSATSANNFASSAVTMAAKAGDVSKSTSLMGSVLDLAAARGIKAEEALEALNLTLKGQDEGLDKLVNKNPSAYYEKWADAAGKSAGKLTDTEKALAIVDGLIADGASVRGSYTDWLDTTAGKAFLAGQKAEEASARFGVATETIRIQMTGAKAWASEALVDVVTFFQKLGVNVGLAWEGAGASVRLSLGRITVWLGEFLGNNRAIMAFLPDAVTAMGERMQESGHKMQQGALKELGVLKGVQKEMYAEIEGAHASAAANMVAQQQQASGKMTDTVSAEGKKQQDAAKKAFEGIADAFRDAYDPGKNPALKQARDAIEKINEALKDQKGLSTKQREELERYRAAYQVNLGLITDALRLEKRLEEVRDLPFQVDRMQELGKLRARAVELRADESASAETIAYYDKYIAELNKQAGVELGKNAQLQDSITYLSRMAALAYAAATGDLREMARLQELLAGETGKTKVANEWSADAIFRAARGGVSLAKEFGLIDDRAANVLNSTINLADTLKNVGESFGAGDIIGVVGSVAGILGSIFGDNAAQKALITKLADGIAKLERTNGLLLRAQSTGAQVDAAKGLLPGFDALGQLKGDGVVSKTRLGTFRSMLQSKGLSISDAEQLAKDMGLDLGIENGGISQAAVQAFAEALRTANFGGFETSFSGALDQLDFEGGLQGGFDSATQLDRLKDILGGQYGSSALAQALQGADLSSAGGRQALLQQLIGLGTDIGNLPDAARGGLTGTEFTDILTRITDLLRDLGVDGGSAPPPPPTTPAFEPPTTGLTEPFTAGEGVTSLAGGVTNISSSDLMSGFKLLSEQGEIMIGLQKRIALAAEETAMHTAIATRAAGGDGFSTGQLDESLLSVLELSDQVLGSAGG